MSDISASTPATAQPVATLPPGYTPPKSTSSNSTSLNGVNANTFLQLLVAELQNQNPSNPTDPSQFLSQTAQFEEVQELNTVQTAVANLVTAQQSAAATSMLGMQVSGSDSAGNPVSGVVTGVQLTSDGPLLTVGDASLPYSSVTSVTVPGVSSSSSTPSSNQTTTGTAGSPTGTATASSGS
jgi:flagellar basal-body rod modification protein FlgD